MLKKKLFILFLGSIAIVASCSKSPEDIGPGDDNGNNNNNTEEKPALPPGWYIDTSSFHTTGTFVTLIGLQKDGKIVAANTRQVARFNKDGSSDNSFKDYTITGGQIHALLIDKDDKVYVGGNFANFNGSSYSYLVRLNADGSIDNSMKPVDISNQGSQGTDIKCLALQSTGKLMIGGTLRYNYYGNGEDHPSTLWYDDLLRLNTDGSVDFDFVNASKIGGLSAPNHNISHINILPDDKMYVSGAIRLLISGADSYMLNIVRLKADGSLDSSFKQTENIGGLLFSATLKDGTTLVGGVGPNTGGAFRAVSDQGEGSFIKDIGFSTVSWKGGYYTDACIFSDDEIFVASKNPSTSLFGETSPGLSMIVRNGKSTVELQDDIGKDVYSVIKESDNTILVAGNMIVNGYSAEEKAMIRLKKHK